jgi:sugar (pentulose or hexulose) kinase
MAGVLNTPVSVMESAGEGGAWGIALLASYMQWGTQNGPLEQFLAEKVFAGKAGSTMAPDAKDVDGFKKFMERYAAGLKIERAAVENF